MEDVKLVFTGSAIEASFIAEILEENGIPFILRDTLDESIIAGWASGSPEDSGLIYVENNDFAKADEVIKVYLSTR
ncbi:MAG: DUF2007 domain-containing protein [Bacteroidales bacterium]|nr:DUF2007 domain-containing protein [Bacteroidales bacterium]